MSQKAFTLIWITDEDGMCKDGRDGSPMKCGFQIYFESKAKTWMCVTKQRRQG